MHKCTNVTQMLKCYSNAQAQMHKCTNAQVDVVYTSRSKQRQVVKSRSSCTTCCHAMTAAQTRLHRHATQQNPPNQTDGHYLLKYYARFAITIRSHKLTATRPGPQTFTSSVSTSKTRRQRFSTLPPYWSVRLLTPLFRNWSSRYLPRQMPMVGEHQTKCQSID